MHGIDATFHQEARLADALFDKLDQFLIGRVEDLCDVVEAQGYRERDCADGIAEGFRNPPGKPGKGADRALLRILMQVRVPGSSERNFETVRGEGAEQTYVTRASDVNDIGIEIVKPVFDLKQVAQK